MPPAPTGKSVSYFRLLWRMPWFTWNSIDKSVHYRYIEFWGWIIGRL